MAGAPRRRATDAAQDMEYAPVPSKVPMQGIKSFALKFDDCSFKDVIIAEKDEVGPYEFTLKLPIFQRLLERAD